MSDYATVQDIISLKRELTADEQERAEALIPVASAALRLEAKKVGKDFDWMLEDDDDLAYIAKDVVANMVLRELNASTTSEPMTQMSQTGLGYTLQGTYLVPGGGLFIKKSELSRLGLRRQKYGMESLWPSDYTE